MPTQPGSFAAKMPAGEDALIRRIQEIERDLRELRTANPLRTAGVEVAPGSMQIGGSLTVTGPAVFITPLPTAPYVGDPEAPTGTSTPAGTLGDATVRAQGDCTAVGVDAQQYLTTGSGNTAVGSNAQAALTIGCGDTAIGTYAQESLADGGGDTAVGYAAQQNLTTGNSNTAVGDIAQRYLTTGACNTAVGDFAQNFLTTGDYNTAVGPSAQSAPLGTAAYATQTASYQTSIGPETGQSSATQVDGITTIGYQATAGAANATSIGRAARADHAGSIALGYQTLTTQVDQVMVGPRDVEITDTTKGLVLVSPGATRMRITVANDGSLLVNGTVVGGGGGGTALFADPGSDELVFWDDSVGAFAPLTASTGLDLTGTDLSVRSATDVQTGIVELATTTEAVTGTDTVRAVTPAGVAAALAAAPGGTPVAPLAKSQLASLSVPNGAWTNITTWATFVTATGGMVGQASGIKVPVAGMYAVGGMTSWTGNATGRRFVSVAVNGVYDAVFFLGGGPTVNAGIFHANTPPGFVVCAANDVISLSVWQDSGGALSVTGAEIDVWQIA